MVFPFPLRISRAHSNTLVIENRVNICTIVSNRCFWKTDLSTSKTSGRPMASAFTTAAKAWLLIWSFWVTFTQTLRHNTDISTSWMCHGRVTVTVTACSLISNFYCVFAMCSLSCFELWFHCSLVCGLLPGCHVLPLFTYIAMCLCCSLALCLHPSTVSALVY